MASGLSAPSRRFITVLSALALVAALALPGVAGAATTNGPRTYEAAVTSDAGVCAAGVPTGFELILTNTSTQQQLGSADVQPGFQVSDATTIIVRSSSGAVLRTLAPPATPGTILRLRNLSAPPGATVTVGFTGVPEAGTYVLDTDDSDGARLVVKQANNFNGPPGNDLTRFGPAPTIDIAACELAFVTQPGDAQVRSAIPGPPQVGIVDAAGEPVAAAGVSVSIALGENPSGAELSATASTDDEGTATFDELSIEQTGLGFTLAASSDGFEPVGSTPFNVYDELCAAGSPCQFTTGAFAEDGLEATASFLAGNDGGGLSVRVSGIEGSGCIDRADVSRLPSELTLIGLGFVPGSKVVEIRIDDGYHKEQPNNGVAFYQVCAQPIPIDGVFTPFTDRYTGEPVGPSGWGYLPDCSAEVGAPCVAARNSAGGSGPLITVRWGSGFRFR
jgi:hypothetical protein